MLRIEATILKNIFKSEKFNTNILPYLKEEYFTELADKTLFNHVAQYIDKYNTPPTLEAVVIQINSDKTINEIQHGEVIELLEEISKDNENTPYDWLYDNTEKFCKERAIYNAISASIGIADGTDKKLSASAIPALLEAALAVSFDTDTGHDYLEDFAARYEKYHTKEDKVPFKSSIMNYVTNGGLTTPSLTAYLAPSGVGKSMVMCSDAADYLEMGLNVVYFTMEMPEHKIAERIDANLLDVDITNLFSLNRNEFNNRIDRIKKKTIGKLLIKQYGTGEGNAALFDKFLIDAKQKKGFVPDVIIVDYLGICCSSKVKLGSSVNSYTLLKCVAEEVRALCQKWNACGITATQTNKSGYNNSDIDVTSTAESMGILHTLDLYFALTVDEGMEELGEIMITQLKNRYGSMAFRRFRMKMERNRMRIVDHPETIMKINDWKAKHGKTPIAMTQPDESVDNDGVVTFGGTKQRAGFAALKF